MALSDRLGEHGRLVVLAVIVYLLGSIFVRARNLLVRNSAAALLPRFITVEYLGDRTQTRFESLVAPFSRPSLRRLGRLGRGEHDADNTHTMALDIIFGGGKRLLAAHKDLFDDYDRLKAEAEFRDAVGIPGVLFTAMALNDAHFSAWAAVVLAAVVLVLAAVLFGHARALDREANSMYAHAVADGVVSTAPAGAGDGGGRGSRRG